MKDGKKIQSDTANINRYRLQLELNFRSTPHITQALESQIHLRIDIKRGLGNLNSHAFVF